MLVLNFRGESSGWREQRQKREGRRGMGAVPSNPSIMLASEQVQDSRTSTESEDPLKTRVMCGTLGRLAFRYSKLFNPNPLSYLPDG